MKATPETRQRMILAVTGLLTPLAFWIAFGLYDRFTPRRRMPEGLFFDPARVSPEERMRTQILRAQLLEAARQGDWRRVSRAADDTCGVDCPSPIFPLQAEAHWRLGEREKGADLWAKGLAWESPVAQAQLQALKGDKAAYTAHVASLLSTPELGLDNDIAWACVLLPDALPDYTLVVARAQKALQLQEADPPGGKANVLNTLGVALYRAGRYSEALARLQESESLQHEMMNGVFIALCCRKLGDRTRARREANSYYQFLRNSLQDNSRNRLEYVLFEKELSAVLPATPPKKAITP
ncbi:hypothetical protein [Armatimonas sp.]|uniref:hypothetical protein n=1 Tax=Armatimonas sp. TaxID=1872638 RepID=UPI0037523D35